MEWSIASTVLSMNVSLVPNQQVNMISMTVSASLCMCVCVCVFVCGVRVCVYVCVCVHVCALFTK